MVRSHELSEWTEGDRKLMLARELYLSSLCPGGCGHPIDRAWHPDNEGWYEPPDKPVVCHACTAMRGSKDESGATEPAEFFGPPVYTRDESTHPLPLLDLEGGD